MDMWELAQIPLPPIIMSNCVSVVDTISIRRLLSKMAHIMTNLTALRKEAAILSRMIYKMDRKFRHDIGYKNLKKTNVALLKFLNFEFIQYVEMFMSVLPAAEDDNTYLPTRQMFEYLLLKIQWLSQLLLRVITVSEQAAVYFIQRIKLGESHWMSVMPFSMLSRVWQMSRQLLTKNCTWFSEFRPLLSQFQYNGEMIMPADYIFSDVLELETDSENLTNHLRAESSFSIKTLPAVDAFSPVIPKISKSIKRLHQSLPDIGQPISRHEFISKNLFPTNTTVETVLDHIDDKVLLSYEKIKKILNNKHTTDISLNKYDLTYFIKYEEEARLNGKLCLTKHLGLMQWHSLKASFENVLLSDDIKSTSPRFLQYVKKIKFLWKNKCIAYK